MPGLDYNSVIIQHLEMPTMSHKNFNQRDLADCMLTDHKALHELDEVHELIDWQNIEKRLDSVHNKKCGNSAYPPLMMFKVLLLQAWYDLSDPMMENIESVHITIENHKPREVHSY